MSALEVASSSCFGVGTLHGAVGSFSRGHQQQIAVSSFQPDPSLSAARLVSDLLGNLGLGLWARAALVEQQLDVIPEESWPHTL